jgi:transcriptional regulator with XRE-family HTH domain
MTTPGKRIANLRKIKGWSRPELGRRLAAAAGRAKPYSGEAVRLYETDANLPGKPVRKALAVVFNIDESYIEYGGKMSTLHQSTASYQLKTPTVPTAQEEILLHLFAGLFKLQRRELIDEMHALYRANEITRKELGQQPLRGVSNAQIEAAFGVTPAPPGNKHPKKKHNGERDLGSAMGDYLDD